MAFDIKNNNTTQDFGTTAFNLTSNAVVFTTNNDAIHREMLFLCKYGFFRQTPAIEYLTQGNMLINLLTLMTGIVGLITTTIAIIRRKTNPLINTYLIIVLCVVYIRFLLRGFSIYFNKIGTENLTFINVFVVMLIAFCWYLYFRELSQSTKWQSKDAIHLIAPSLVLILYIVNVQQQFKYDKTIRILYVILMTLSQIVYNSINFLLLRNTIWTKKEENPFISKQTKAIKIWTIYLFVAIVVLGLMIILVFITNGYNYNSKGNSYQIIIASVFWMVFFIKLLATPELLHGYDFMKVKIESYKKAEVVLNTVWILNTTPEITNQKDLKIASNVTANLNNYIYQIESLSFHTNTFRNTEFTVEDFAKKLHLPKVHLLYVFKYHCDLSFVEYKNMVRIHDAIKLLETGFLKSNTMESLAKEVGFSTYKPFYSSFKTITGSTPQEYCKNLK